MPTTVLAQETNRAPDATASGAAASVIQPNNVSAINQPERAPDSFPIYAIDVSGVTKLPAAELERIIYKFTGEAKSNADVEAARKAIQDAYVAKGYESVIVESPLQQRELFSAGVITIVVTESPVANVRVVGSKYHSDRVVRRQLPAIAEGQPLDFKALQTQFSAVNRFPDRSVEFSPKAGEKPGTIDVDLVVKDKLPLHSTFELNNDNSPSTTPLRLSGNLRYTDLWKLGHTLYAGFVIAPQRKSDSAVVSGSYRAPILGTPWTLSVTGYRSNSAIAALGGTTSLGNGYQIGVRADYALPATDSRQSVGIQVDWKNFTQDILLNGTSVGQTPIRYIPLTVDYSIFAADADSGFAKKVGTSTFGITVGATVGLRAVKRQLCTDLLNTLRPVAECLNGTPGRILDDQFQIATRNGNENFVRFNAAFNYQLATASDWLFTANWVVQAADQHLVTNEQFSAGGRDTVRGYFQSEVIGDQGVVTSVEFGTPSLAPMLGKWVDELRFYSFVDAAIVRTLATPPGENSISKLLSVGGGARMKLFDRLNGELIVGVPINDSPQSASDQRNNVLPTSQKGKVRTTFVVRAEF